MNSADRATQQEKILRDKGYSGYFVRHPKLGDVASIFDPLRKGFTHTVRMMAPLAPVAQVAGGGILGALALGRSKKSEASTLTGGLTMPSMKKVGEALDRDQQSRSAGTINEILNFLDPAFIMPQALGGGVDTMEGYLRSKTR